MKQYDYSKLKGKIKECFATQWDFAQKLGISDTSLSYKLNNKTVFDQDKIYKAAPIFHSAFYQLFDEGIFEDIRTGLYANVQRLNNVRNIKNIIEELVGIELVKNILEDK